MRPALAAAALLAWAESPLRCAGIDAQTLNRLFDGSGPSAAAVAAPVVAGQRTGLTHRQPIAGLSRPQKQALDALDRALPAAARAWPGYDFLGKPFLAVLTDGSALLIGHPSPPREFQPAVHHGRIVHVATQGPDIGFPFRTDYELGGLAVMAVRADPEEEIASTIRLAVHERFHDYQTDEFTRDNKPYRVEEPEDIALAELENRALARWLRTGAADSLRDFAALRRRRRALFPDSAAETGQENLEGTARFVDEQAYASMKGARAARDSILRSLEGTVTIGDLKKWRLYGVGAALGRYLETTAARGAWQSQVAGGVRLSEIVLSQLPQDQQEIASRVARLTAGSDYSFARFAAQIEIESLQTRRRETLAKFEKQAGLRVRFAPKGRRYFSSKGWLDYPDGTRLFDPVIVYSGTDFKFENIMLRNIGERLEFFLAPEGIVELDGTPWTPGDGPRRFSRIAVSAPGVTVDTGPGELRQEDGTVVIDVPASDAPGSVAASTAGCRECAAF